MLRNLWRKLTQRSRTSHGRPKSRRTVPLRVEPLEDRVVPAAIVWDNKFTDNFYQFGANEAAARKVVEAAMSAWEDVIESFDYDSGPDVFHLTITGVDIPTEENALAYGGPASLDGDGKPRHGIINIDTAGVNWFFDPTPHLHNEFTGPVNGYAAMSVLTDQVDLYSTVLHEIGHALGFALDATSTELTPLRSEDYLTSLETPDPNKPEHVLHSFASKNAAPPFTATFAVNVDEENLYAHLYAGPPPGVDGEAGHPHDLMSAPRPWGMRRVISQLDANILADVYGYTMNTPAGIHAAPPPEAHLNAASGVLTITGDHQVSATDNIVISRANNTVNVTVNGHLHQYTQSALFGGIQVNARSGNDSVVVDLTNGPVTWGGAPVSVDGGGSDDALTLIKSANWTVDASTVKIGATTIAAYESVEIMWIESGDDPNTITVQDTAVNLKDLTIFADGGADTIFVRNFADDTEVLIYGGGENDFFSVGDGNTLEGLGDKLTLSGGSDTDTLTIHNEGTATGNSFLVHADHVEYQGHNIHFTNSMETVTVRSGTANDYFEVVSGPAVTFVTLNGGTGSDTLLGADLFNIWNLTGINAGNLNTKVSFQSVENLTGGSAGDTFKFHNYGSIVWGEINGGDGADTLDYSNAGNTATVNLQNGDATGVGLEVASIESMVGSSGWDTLIGRNGPNTWNLTSGNVQWFDGIPRFFTFSAVDNLIGGSSSDILRGPNAATSWNLTADKAGNINDSLFFSSMDSLVGGTNNDSFNVSNGVAYTGDMDGGTGGWDLLNYHAWYSPATISLQKAIHMDQVFGGSGSDTLIGPAGGSTWNISSNAGKVNNATSFIWIENLWGGLGDDRFVFGNGSSLTGTINGWLGVDTLDYSARTAAFPVVANLATGTASGVAGGVSKIENVTGGAGNDTLIGNSLDNLLRGMGGLDLLQGGDGHDILVGGADNDILEGGQGRDLLFGGLGVDQLTGGANDDLLIGGSFFFEFSDSDLRAMRSVWSASDLNNLAAYQARVNQLLDDWFFEDYIVSDIDPDDVLTGGDGLDWFWANMNDTTDRNAAIGEVLS